MNLSGIIEDLKEDTNEEASQPEEGQEYIKLEEATASGNDWEDEPIIVEDSNPFSDDIEEEEEGEEFRVEEDEDLLTDKELAALLVVFIDMLFAMGWSLFSSHSMSAFKLPKDSKKELETAAIPWVRTFTRKADPMSLFLLTVIALQVPNSFKANEIRAQKKKEKKEKGEASKSQGDENSTSSTQEKTNSDEIVYRYDERGVKQPSKKRCSYCGKFGHNKASCSKRIQDEKRAKEKGENAENK